MMEYWNQCVQKEDEVYILGDFQYRSSKGPVWYLQRLKGKKYLIIGNHDAKTLKYLLPTTSDSWNRIRLVGGIFRRLIGNDF